MSRSLSPTASASLYAAGTDQVWLCLLTIEHPDLPAPLRFVNNPVSVQSRGMTFVAYPFEIEFPGQGEDGPTEARVAIDNADRSVLLALRELEGPLSVTVEVVLASSLDTVEVSIPGLSLREVDWDEKRVRGALRVEDLLSEPLSLQMTPARLPGLH
ncbi:DUF1833 family protein [Rubellimicrobium sp. CFH 75288]|uniref:DUF1833 family protein n=1 Tax=Rubellimicrobium sp. CFH 75288 TaxID=2697034 RepID=UPI001413681F|nr:DUF1833 domain-containing protein [Rubellimicrobium sp. CFH 75288]